MGACGINPGPRQPGPHERRVQAAHLAGRHARGPVQALVHAPLERVHQRLDVQPHPFHGSRVGSQPREHHLAHVGPTVAVGVLHVPNVRRGTHEHPAVPARDRRRPRQPLRHHARLVEHPVPVRVAKPPNPPQALVPVLRIVPHLDYPCRPRLVDRHGDGALHQGFVGQQPGAEPRADVEGGGGPVRGGGRDPGHLGCVGDGLGSPRAGEPHQEKARAALQ